MFQKVLVFIIMLFSVNAYAHHRESCSVFSESQIETMRNAYFEGADRNYGWELAAIAWQESSAGKHKVNLAGPAYGVFHNLLSSVARRHGIKDRCGKREIKRRLINEDDYAAEQAMLELDYWKGRHKGNMDRVLASYYAGGNWMHKPGQKYKSIIKSKINFLQRNGCLVYEREPT